MSQATIVTPATGTRGALFHAENRSSDRAPVMTGSWGEKADGGRLAAFAKNTAAAGDFFSLSFEGPKGQEGKWFGNLFPARSKKTEKSPDFSGSMKVNGIEFWLSGWNSKSAGGKEYISLAVGNEKQGRPAAAPAPSSDLDDDVPF